MARDAGIRLLSQDREANHSRPQQDLRNPITVL
jgi:hypothetical protein